MPFKNSDTSFNLKLMGGNNSVLLKSTDISHNANTVAFTGLPANLYTSDFYLKDGYVDYFYQEHPLGLSGENVTLWKQTVAGGNISISGDEYYGHTEISGGSWPVTILGTGTKVTLETDLVLDVSTNYFKFATGCSAEFVGDTVIPQKTVDVSGVTDGWPGLFDCSSSGSTMNVKYLGVTASNSSELAQNAGWVVGINAGRDGSCNIYNCYSTGDIGGGGGYEGGIAGYGAGYGGSCNVYNCYSTGDISGQHAGGIAGYGAGYGGSCNVHNCYSTGRIGNNNYYQGGIVGSNAGNSYGSCNIYNCYSTGTIDNGGYFQGGIVGSNAGKDGSCNIYNCFSTGDIGGYYQGGIVGTNAGSQGSCNIYNCYSTGDILGFRGGGITGDGTAEGGGTVNISNCYVLGATDGVNAYTIYGASYNGGVINVSDSTPQTDSQTAQPWSDTSANTFLSGLNSTWKDVTPLTVSAEPWKLKAFLNDTSNNFDSGTMTYTNNVFPIMPFKNTDTSFNIKLIGRGTYEFASTDISHNANTIAFTGLPTNLYTSNFYLKDGYVDHFYQDHPLGLSGENITLWQQSSPGGNISISGDEYYGNTEISGGSWPVTILGGNTKVTLETDLVLDVSTNYFKFDPGCSAEFVGDTIIPQRTVDISGVTDGWPGLLDCSSSGSTMNVKYLGVTASNSSKLSDSGGWVAGVNSGSDGSCNINNCYSTGDIGGGGGKYQGGIVGDYPQVINGKL